MPKLDAVEYESFEAIKQTDENGNEYWFARDLQKTLLYTEWRNFHKVIDRAILACKNSGFDVGERFVEVSKTIKMPTNLWQMRSFYLEYSQNEILKSSVSELGKSNLPPLVAEMSTH